LLLSILTLENRAHGHTMMRRLIVAASSFGLVAVIVVSSVVLIGGDQLVDRFESVGKELKDNNNERINRVEIWRSAMQLVREHPVAGAGFGAFSVGVTAFDSADGGRFKLEQAHNDYLEIAAGGGVIGLAFCAAFLFNLGRSIRARLSHATAISRAASIGATGGIAAVLVHSFFDFGLHAGVNAAVFTMLSVIAMAQNRAEE